MKTFNILLLAAFLTSCTAINNIQCRKTISDYDKHLYKAQEKKTKAYILGCITSEDTSRHITVQEDVVPMVVKGEKLVVMCDSLNEVIFYLQDSLGYLRSLSNNESVRTIIKYIEKNGQKAAEVEIKEVEYELKTITKTVTEKPKINVQANKTPNSGFWYLLLGVLFFLILLLTLYLFSKRMNE